MKVTDILPSAEILETLLDSVNVGVLVINRQGRVVLYNSECARIDGLERSDVLGRNMLEVFPSLNSETSILFQILKTGKPKLNVTQKFTNFNGRVISTVSSSFPLIVKGQTWGAMEVSQDINLAWETYDRIIELQAELAQATAHRKKISRERPGFNTIITCDESMQKAINLGHRAAGLDCPVVVYGETGTGKELFVKAVHAESSRKKGPLISQNCAALPETILEAALFGTKSGAFTGAQNRPGLFELADKGTLFLDEIVSAPVALQSKLLRVLEDMIVRRVGGTDSVKVDVRVIASLNMQPDEAIARGLLRRDFFYRLAFMYIALTPLRDRRKDIPLLVNHFLDLHAEATGEQYILSAEVLDILHKHQWPGNVRELKNMLEGAASVAENGEIGIEHLSILRESSYTGMNIPWESPSDCSAPFAANEEAGLQECLANYEREIIESCLLKHGGNLTAASRTLKLPRQTLWSKVRKLGIDTRLK